MRLTKTSFRPLRNGLTLHTFWRLLFAIVCIGSSASGQHAPFDIAEEVRKADTIVVGRVQSVREVGSRNIEIGGRSILAKTFIGQVQVDRVLKGTNVTRAADVQFEIPNSPAGSLGYSGITRGTYRMLFLRHSDEHFVFANPYLPSLPAISRSPSSKSTEPLAVVLDELRNVIDSPETPETAKLGLIYRLGSTSSDAVIGILTPELENSSPTIRAATSAALIERGYLPALMTAQQVLVRPPADVPEYVLLNLTSAIGRYVSDEKAIPALRIILHSPIVQARRSAADALRRTASERALSSLALALNDGDQQVRYLAVIGFGEITGQADWRPLMGDYVQNENKYLDHWRNWAKAHVK